MNIKSSGLLALSLVVVASITTSVPAVRNQDTGVTTISNHATADQPAPTPIVVAQGRCFNGRCY
jgi:hypothetical protein